MKDIKPIESYTVLPNYQWCNASQVRELESDYTELEKKYEKRDKDARRFIDQIVELKQEKYNHKHWCEQQKYEISELEKKLEIAVEALRNVAENYDHDIDAHKYGTVCRMCDAEKTLAELKGDQNEV